MRHLDGFCEGIAEADEASLVAPCFRQFEQAPFGIVNLLRRRHVNRRVKGDIDHVLADADQVPAQRQVIDAAAIVLGIDDRGGIGGKAQEKLGGRQIGDFGFRRIKGLQCDRRGGLARPDQLADFFINILVRRNEEMERLQKVGHSVIGLVVDENGAKQLAFGFRVMRRHALCSGFRFNRL